MRKLMLLAVLLLSLQMGMANSNPPSDYSKIDAHARNVPAKYARNVEELAQYLSKPAKSDFEKVRSFFVWMSSNITYDVELFRRYRPGTSMNITAEDILKQKKAVCQGYADLFIALCEEEGIVSKMIPGYSKGFGNRNRTDFSTADHAWNAVMLDGKWYLLDATWGAGGLNEKMQYVAQFNEQFFLSDPKVFIQDHMPLYPMWQLLDCPVSMKAFMKGDEAIAQELSSSKKCVDFKQQIDSYEVMAEAERELNLAEAAYAFNPQNHVVMARGYMDFAHSIMSSISRELRSKEEIENAIGVQENALQYLMKAETVLKNVKDNSANVEKDFVSKNIQHSEENLKAMRAVLKG